jgi:hypothetical protein
MRGRTWQRTNPKPATPKVTEELRAVLDAQAIHVVEALKKRLPKPPQHPVLNWPADVFTRWHRNALYFVVVLRTPHGSPTIFETHAARMEHDGDGKFNLAVPMRRGWNTFMRDATPEACLREISDIVCF